MNTKNRLSDYEGSGSGWDLGAVGGSTVTHAGLTPAPRAEQRTARSARIPRTAYVAAQAGSGSTI